MKIFAEEMAAVSHADTDTDFTERERERYGMVGKEERLNQIEEKPKKDHEISVTLDIIISVILVSLSLSLYFLFVSKGVILKFQNPPTTLSLSCAFTL